jgi:hypothetical protein
VGVGVVVGVVVGVGVGLGDDVGVGDAVDDGLAVTVWVLPPPEPDDVSLVVGLGDADAFADELADADGFAVVEVAAELDGLAVVDGVGVGVEAEAGVAAKAVAATPLEITKRPVARPSVTGRVYAGGIRTPYLWWLSRRV